MHENENFFKQHKFLLALFVLTFIVFLASIFISTRGAFFDVPAIFFAVINKTLNSPIGDFVYFVDCRTRNFSNFLLAVPFNIVLLFKIKSIQTLLNFFATSYYLMTFLALVFNYIIALRTKRFDIAVLALVFYSFCIIPNAIWPTREINIATMLQFGLLSYFLSREKLNKLDLIPITLLLIYLFESFESSVLVGPLLFISSLFYLRKDNKTYNSPVKLYIGIVALLAATYITLKTIYLGSSTHSDFTIAIALQQYTDSIKNLTNNLFNGCLLITFAGIFASALILFYKKPFRKNLIMLVVLYMLVSLIINTRFVPNPLIEIHYYALSILLILPFMLLIIISDYFNIKFQKINPYFYSNLLFTAYIIGIIGFGWQINSSFYFKEYIDYYKNLLKTSKETILIQPKRTKDQEFLAFDNCFGSTHRSILLSPSYRIETLVFPDKTSKDYNPFCFEGSDHTFYSEKTNQLILQTTPFQIKTDYWDLSDIVTEFKKEKRVKDQ